MNALTEHAPAILAAILIASIYYIVRTRTRAAHEAVMAQRRAEGNSWSFTGNPSHASLIPRPHPGL